ncbi:MAG: T9SS type A sorting domain-containing protein [Chitinophagales bacterium]
MRKIILSLALSISIVFGIKAQLVSYSIQDSFTKQELRTFLDNSGFGLPITPKYDVDVYQIFYKTPYKHIDSLITTSGIVAVPKNKDCPSLLAAYGHGTFSERNSSASYNAAERPITFLFAGFGGVVTVMPDILGLGAGSGDSAILIHPYVNTFHNGHTIINSMRAARELADILSSPLNGEVVLTGYSQGGHTAMAANKLIQENYAQEFDIMASIPMSGPYDLNKTMVDVMLSSDSFSVPGYLPYLLLGYHSIYDTLQSEFPNASDIFKSPYDTVLPPLFYSKTNGIGHINGFCDPIPRQMIKDSIIQKFENDLNHPLRFVLNDNDLMGWAPQNTVKIHYCTEDEEVNYLNGVRADSAWRANGAPDVEAFNNGALNHFGCVEPSVTATALYLLTNLPTCTDIFEVGELDFSLYPNPANEVFNIESGESDLLMNIYSLSGKVIMSQQLLSNLESIDISHLVSGIYFVELRNNSGEYALKKLVKN